MSLLLLACCVTVLAYHSTRIWLFGKQTEGIDAVLRQLRPGERMLSLPFDSGSPEVPYRLAHMHYGGWYQADSRGFADCNFAWFRPQIVRFKASERPRVREEFSWEARDFDWHHHEGWRYRYFLASGPVPAGLFTGAPCPPVTVFTDGLFTVLENRAAGQPNGHCSGSGGE